MKSSKLPRVLSPELPQGLCPEPTGKLSEFTASSDLLITHSTPFNLCPLFINIWHPNMYC